VFVDELTVLAEQGEQLLLVAVGVARVQLGGGLVEAVEEAERLPGAGRRRVQEHPAPIVRVHFSAGEVVRQLMQHHRDPLKHLSAREREVLALVAQGHSNAAAARLLSLTEAGVAKHIGNVLTKLNLPVSDDTNRRVLAVLAYLRSRPD
jgi:DNA-binding NarL/FixJ family response regulator